MDKKSHKHKTFWGWVWHYCCSIKVALTLLIIIALVSIVGTLIAQEAPEKLLEFYKPQTVKIITGLGLNDVYGAWWFVTLLFLLIVNMTCCTWNRLLPTWKLITHPREQVSATFMKDRKNHDEFTSTAINELSDVVSVVRKSGYRVKIHADNHLYAAKGRWTRIGYIITHISIIMVLLGAIIGKMAGYKGFMPIREGENTPRYWSRTLNSEAQFDFSIRLNKLYMEYWRPEFFLRVIDPQNGGVLLAPKVNMGESFKIPGTKIKGTITDYRSNYKTADGIDWMSENRSVDVKPSNPSIFVEFFEKDVPIGEQWVFIPGSPMQKGNVVPGVKVVLYNLITDRTKDFKSELEVYDQGKHIFTKTIEVNDPLRYKGITFYQSSFDIARRTTGLQVARDPGVPIVYIFCTTMIIGVMFSFGMGTLFLVIPLSEIIWLISQWGAYGPIVTLGGILLAAISCYLGVIASTKTKLSLGGIVLLSILGYVATMFMLSGSQAMIVLITLITNWCLGFMMTLGVLHRQLWFNLEKTPKGLKVLMAGLAHRNPLGFRLEYDKILSALSGQKSAE